MRDDGLPPLAVLTRYGGKGWELQGPRYDIW